MNYDKAFYISWKDMIRRCNDDLCAAWPNYGGRGIDHSVSWEDFKNFFRDMHDSWFPGATLDRKDPERHYCKENCMWILKEDQTSVGRLRRRYNNRTGVTGVERLSPNCWRVIVRERGAERGKGKKYSLYRGPDFFEACCTRKAWEAAESKILASSLKPR